MIERGPEYSVEIPLSGASIPASLKRIDLEVEVADGSFPQRFTAAPNQTTTFIWDGKDAYGRKLQGEQPVFMHVGFVYDGVYMDLFPNAAPARLCRERPASGFLAVSRHAKRLPCGRTGPARQGGGMVLRKVPAADLTCTMSMIPDRRLHFGDGHNRGRMSCQ